MDARAEFEERLRRDVARTLRHITLSGGDVRDLGGAVMLRFDDAGVLEVAFNNPATVLVRGAGEVVDIDALVEKTAPEKRTPKKLKGEDPEAEGD